ncbi:1847_t:CDS:10 [Paraglomus occultum]|uniref:1847_t:CDS:1 n=1 Tax=Paraglomus occultum TaxID=144539 RepID=A0A9N9ATU3_9GLOM|nr:1847_t:CDS:10 [Paraglomus occultum]
MLDGPAVSRPLQAQCMQLVETLQSIICSPDATTELKPGMFQNALVWYFHAPVQHPLRALYGYKKSFFLLTKNSVADKQATNIVRELEATPRIVISSRATDKKWFLGGVEPISRENVIEYRMKADQTTLEPLSQEDASLAQSYQEEAKDLSAVFAFCVGTKSYIGLELDLDGGITKNFSTRQTNMLKRLYVVEDEGEVSSVQGEECLSIPSLDVLLERYREAMGQEKNSLETLSGQVFAKYRLDLTLGKKAFKESPSTITLEICWQDIHQPLSPPPSLAAVSLNINIASGEYDIVNHQPTCGLLVELTRLIKWYLAAFSGDGWGTNVTESMNETFNGIAQTVRVFLEDVKFEGSVSNIGDETTTSFMSFQNSSLVHRKDLDFTEKLWNFCQGGAKNHTDLVSALAVVFEELETGKLQPTCHKDNHSSFANTIRECLKLARIQTSTDYNEVKEHIHDIFNFWLGQPLECMIEVGLFKLKRDYCYHLIGNDLVTWSELEPFLDATQQLSEQIERLRQLHRIVETWSFVKRALPQVPYESMRNLIRTLVDYYKGFPVDEINNPRVQAPLSCTVYLPKYSSATEQLITDLFKSSKQTILPTYWEMSIREDLAEKGGGLVSHSVKAYSDIFFVQFDQLDTLNEKRETQDVMETDDKVFVDAIDEEMSLTGAGTELITNKNHKYHMTIATSQLRYSSQ